MMRSNRDRFIIILVLLGVAQSLDIEIVGASCDSSFPVTADIKMSCEKGTRCTFGEQVTISGKLHYHNVANTGIQNNMAYMSTDLFLWTLDFNLFEMLMVPLCDSSMVSDNGYECPYNGSYSYSVSYVLPGSGGEKTSWLATGWNGQGVIQLFAEKDENMKIGECILDLKTYVTPSAEKKTGIRSRLGTPSAAVTAGLVLGASTVLGMVCLYCYCCCCRKERNTKVVPVDEIAYFKQMEDDKSFWSGTSKKTNKTAASGNSVVSAL